MRVAVEARGHSQCVAFYPSDERTFAIEYGKNLLKYAMHASAVIVITGDGGEEGSWQQLEMEALRSESISFARMTLGQYESMYPLGDPRPAGAGDSGAAGVATLLPARGPVKLKYVPCAGGSDCCGWHLEVHRYFRADERNGMSTYVVAIDPRDPHAHLGAWEVEQGSQPGRVTLAYIPSLKGSRRQPPGWCLAVHRYLRADCRNDSTTYAIAVDRNHRKAMLGEWEVRPGTRPGRVVLAYVPDSSNRQNYGWHLAVHRYFRADRRSETTAYAIVVDPNDPHAFLGEWEVEA